MEQNLAQPQNCGQLLRKSFELFRTLLWTLLPFSFIAAIISVNVELNIVTDPHEIFTHSMNFGANVRFFIINLAVMLFVSFCYAAILNQLQIKLAGNKFVFTFVLKKALLQTPFIFFGFVIYFFILFGGLALLLIPGIIFGVSCFLMIALLGTEMKNPFAAMIRSHRLSWPYWGKVFCLTALPMIALVCLVSFSNWVTGHVFFRYPEQVSMLFWVNMIANIVLGVLYAPWYYSLQMVLLSDLKRFEHPVHHAPHAEHNKLVNLLDHET